MNISKFLDRFKENYNFLYDNNDRVSGYYEALDYGEKIIHEKPDFVGEFVRFRGDFLSSDREVAAFGFTMSDFGY